MTALLEGDWRPSPMILTATAFLRFAGLAETPTANAKTAVKLISKVFIFDSEEPVIGI